VLGPPEDQPSLFEPDTGESETRSDTSPPGRREIDDAPGDEPEEWPTEMAEQSPYGVSTPDAFSALADSGDDDLEDWESFVGESAVGRDLDPPEPPSNTADFADEGEQDEGSRPRRRPSRWQRRREAKAAAAAEAAAAAAVAAQDEAVAAADQVDAVDVPSDPGVEGGVRESWWQRRRREKAEAAAAPEAEAAAEWDDAGTDVPDWVSRGAQDPADHQSTASEPDDPAMGTMAGETFDDEDAEGTAPIPEPPDQAFVEDDETVWLVSEQPLVGEQPPVAPLAGPAPGASGNDAPSPSEPPEPGEVWVEGGDEESAWLHEPGLVPDAPQGRDAIPAADDALLEDALGDYDEWSSEPGEGRLEATPGPPEDEYEFGEDAFADSVTREHRGLAEEIVRAGEEDALEWQPVSASMPGIGTGVVGFDDVADLETDEGDYVTVERSSDLGARVATGLILVGLLFGSLWVGAEAFALFVGFLVMLGLGEFYTALRLRGFRPIALFGYLGGAGLLAGAWVHGPVAIPVAVILTTVLTYFAYAFSPLGRDALTNGGLTVLGVVWIPAAASFVYPLAQAEGFRVLVLTVVAVIVAMDIGAFAVGRLWGSRPLAPILSPNKSIEGLVGGVVISAAAALGAAVLFEEITVADAAALAAVVAVLAPVGDLVESMIKRSLAIKDMGTILPGHGGVLDRVDAFLFVLPGVWVLFWALGLIG
jgi:phosphatidate cytidylyltransferase